MTKNDVQKGGPKVAHLDVKSGRCIKEASEARAVVKTAQGGVEKTVSKTTTFRETVKNH